MEVRAPPPPGASVSLLLPDELLTFVSVRVGEPP